MNPRDNNRGAVADSANEGNSRLVDFGERRVTLRSPTAKSLRLTPQGSRLSGDMAAEVCNRAAVNIVGNLQREGDCGFLEAPIELQVGGGVAAVGTAMLSSVVVNLVEVELQFEVLQNPIFSRDAVYGLGG